MTPESPSIQESAWSSVPVTTGALSQAYGSEYVLAIVAPVGVSLAGLVETAEEFCLRIGYEVRPYRLSTLISEYTEGAAPFDEHERINYFIGQGNAIRKGSGNDSIARMAIAGIRRNRPIDIRAGAAHAVTDVLPLPRTVHLVISLKRPEEVELLRQVYSTSLLVAGVYAPRDKRRMYLTGKGMSSAKAEALIEKDEYEPDPHGQKTRDTFELADAFVASDECGVSREQLNRLFRLVFGDPFCGPTQDEYGMFTAYSAALCSSGLSRQVGAAILRGGDVLATGRNDVPQYGGGAYWPGAGDKRDYVLGYDPNEREKQQIIIEAARLLNRERWSGQSDEAVGSDARIALKDSRLMAISEFGRDVHAEMDSLLTAARLGVSVKDATLYTTTFPCHNCAKHIVNAGIRRVIYVEPYPKSRAAALFPDTIAIDEPHRNDKVSFEPFIGIGPRRFFDLFSMKLSGGYTVERKKDGVVVPWPGSGQSPRLSLLPSSYIERESLAVDELLETLPRKVEGTPEKSQDGEPHG